MRRPSLIVEELANGGYAVHTKDLKYKIGPNPLTKRGAECVLAVIRRLGIDCRAPQPATARMQNEKAIGGCPKLKRWLTNDWRPNDHI